jgi:ribosomal protein S18 acetylase RimI-like enzyme
MINVSLQVRRAVPEDQQQIASLMFHEANIHRHLDWRSPLDWLGSPDYWVLEDGARLTAALACPQDPPHISWIRLFGFLPHLSGPQAWQPLWDSARADILRAGQTQVAAIVVKHWFQNLLLASGFEARQSIVLLELKNENFRPFPAPQGVRIRLMLEADLQAATQLDIDVFGPFWHNSLDALRRALSQAVYASVAEDELGVIGYQLSTGNPFGAHLARLAVRTEAQGRGIGAALVSDLIHRLDPNHLARLSVNTQADNEPSLSLYKKIGFTRTGEHFPVLVYPKGN